MGCAGHAEIFHEGTRLERTRDYLDVIARRLNKKFPKRHFEVESTATYGLRIFFEFEQMPVYNPVRDLLGLRSVSPLYYGLDEDTARVLLDANGIYEPGYTEAPADD
jgi:hypothetical protein